MSNPATVLIFGYGNPGRGDDGLGPACVDCLEAEGIPDVEYLSDMQLQVEHVTDLQGRSFILFVDADMSCDAPYVLERLSAEQDESYSSHAMSPAALLHAYRKAYGTDAPPGFVLRIRGYDFALGEALSAEARINLAKAVTCVRRLCANRDIASWEHTACPAEQDSPDFGILEQKTG